ncbi:ubiquinol-cytochrome c reductase iron-sulfur subunit [candidate division KSB1 bacterium]
MSEIEEKKDINPDADNDPQKSQDGKEAKPDQLPEPGRVRLGRRNFIGKMLIGCGAALGIEAGYASVKLMASKPVAEKVPVVLSLAQLQPGSRTTVLYGGNKIEVVRDENGIVTAKSMVCTHLGCLVIWGEENRTYHCPCHDAYFDEDGGVISGPPTQPLEHIPVTVSGNTVTIGG